MTPLTLTQICIYPIKSLGGISLNKAVVQKKGLQHDRRWMLIDEDAVAMTQRVYPEMSLFKPGIDDGEIHVTYRKEGRTIASASFPLSHRTSNHNTTTARVWADEVQVVEVNTQLSEWFSDHLRTRCKLVAFPEDNARPVDTRYALANDQVSLADAYPFLIIGQGSLDDLNTRLAEPVSMNRFRPNFVFTAGTPYVEDSWREVSIGSVRFAAVKKSDRCVLTTVNQDTAEKGLEPLRTLSGYRKVDNKVYFGQNMIALEEGMVAVGDVIIPR